MPEYEEKRNFVRMDSNCKMTYKFVDSDQQHDATCINLSGAGILFKVDEEIEPGKALEIVLTPENKLTPPLNAFVEVVRASVASNGIYEIAASIKGIKSN